MLADGKDQLPPAPPHLWIFWPSNGIHRRIQIRPGLFQWTRADEDPLFSLTGIPKGGAGAGLDPDDATRTPSPTGSSSLAFSAPTARELKLQGGPSGKPFVRRRVGFDKTIITGEAF